MFIVFYRWRIKNGLERQFIAAWSEITSYIRENYNSLGSRLHRGNDGIFYAYAQWYSEEQRERAFSAMPELAVRKSMREAIEESLPEITLECVSDYLILPESK